MKPRRIIATAGWVTLQLFFSQVSAPATEIVAYVVARQGDAFLSSPEGVRKRIWVGQAMAEGDRMELSTGAEVQVLSIAASPTTSAQVFRAGSHQVRRGSAVPPPASSDRSVFAFGGNPAMVSTLLQLHALADVGDSSQGRPAGGFERAPPGPAYPVAQCLGTEPLFRWSFPGVAPPYKLTLRQLPDGPARSFENLPAACWKPLAPLPACVHEWSVESACGSPTPAMRFTPLPWSVVPADAAQPVWSAALAASQNSEYRRMETGRLSGLALSMLRPAPAESLLLFWELLRRTPEDVGLRKSVDDLMSRLGLRPPLRVPYLCSLELPASRSDSVSPCSSLRDWGPGLPALSSFRLTDELGERRRELAGFGTRLDLARIRCDSRQLLELSRTLEAAEASSRKQSDLVRARELYGEAVAAALFARDRTCLRTMSDLPAVRTDGVLRDRCQAALQDKEEALSPVGIHNLTAVKVTVFVEGARPVEVQAGGGVDGLCLSEGFHAYAVNEAGRTVFGPQWCHPPPEGRMEINVHPRN